MSTSTATSVNSPVLERSEPEVLITRVFAAPRELVFQAWTDPEHLMHWYAPRGCAIHFRTLDLRPGGRFHSCIRTPDGHDCWCTGVYREIAAPERIVYTLALADENGNPAAADQAGKDPDWPQETVVTVTFTALGDKTTELILHQTVSEALAKRTGAHPSWLDMLDRLAEELEKS
jgi:uncharacterized protein YndB with AHSA1/START domain